MIFRKTNLVSEEIPLADAFAVVGPSDTTNKANIIDHYPPTAIEFIKELNLVYIFVLLSPIFVFLMDLVKLT